MKMTKCDGAGATRTLPASAAHAGVDWGLLARRFGAVWLIAFATGLCAHIAIPLPHTPIPVTLQTFAVVGGALAFGPRLGVIGMLLYLALGLVSPWFFAEGKSGVDVLFGASGGYLFGFIIAAPVVGAMLGVKRGAKPSWDRLAWSVLAGYAIIFVFGLIWLWIAMGSNVSFEALSDLLWAGLWPFIPGAAIKAGATLGLGRVLRRVGEGVRW